MSLRAVRQKTHQTYPQSPANNPPSVINARTVQHASVAAGMTHGLCTLFHQPALPTGGCSVQQQLITAVRLCSIAALLLRLPLARLRVNPNCPWLSRALLPPIWRFPLARGVSPIRRSERRLVTLAAAAVRPPATSR